MPEPNGEIIRPISPINIPPTKPVRKFSLSRILVAVILIVALGTGLYSLIDVPISWRAWNAFEALSEDLRSGKQLTDQEVHGIVQQAPTSGAEGDRNTYDEQYQYIGYLREHTITVRYIVLEDGTRRVCRIQKMSTKGPLGLLLGL